MAEKDEIIEFSTDDKPEETQQDTTTEPTAEGAYICEVHFHSFRTIPLPLFVVHQTLQIHWIKMAMLLLT